MFPLSAPIAVSSLELGFLYDTVPDAVALAVQLFVFTTFVAVTLTVYVFAAVMLLDDEELLPFDQAYDVNVPTLSLADTERFVLLPGHIVLFSIESVPTLGAFTVTATSFCETQFPPPFL